MNAIVTCPSCGTMQEEEMPENLSMVGYFCEGCKSEVFSEKNFCIFCDFGEKPCHAMHFKFNRSFVEMVEEVHGTGEKKSRGKKNG